MDIDLNCDLGEGGAHDADLLALVTSASIACGFHAGDPGTAAETLRQAARSGVVAGAHPSFPDREHFGRREMTRSPRHVFEECAYQVGALTLLARGLGWPLRYVKPHGALYTQACRDEDYARPVVDVCDLAGLALVGLPGSALERASRGRCPFIAEGFADRRYRPDGSLVPRSDPGAFVTDAAEAVDQADRLVHAHGVRTLCVHGDNPRALDFVRAVRGRLVTLGFSPRAFA